MKSITWTLLLAFYSLHIFSTETDLPFDKDLIALAHAAAPPVLPENPIPLADLVGEPSTIVNGVNVITGDYIEHDSDLVTAGIKPLALDRSYYSTDDRAGSLRGGWNFCFGSTLLLNEFDLEEEEEHKALLLEGSCTTEFYGKDKGRPNELSVCKKMLEKGVTNTSTGQMAARTNIKNTKILFMGKNGREIVVTNGMGMKQYFDKHLSANYDSFVLGFYDRFKMTKEIEPDGGITTYGYQHRSRFKKVKRMNKDEKIVSSLIFKERKHSLIVKAGEEDGREVKYHFSDKNLSKVERPNSPWVSYEYKNPYDCRFMTRKDYEDGRFKLIDYYQTGKNRLGPDRRFLKETDFRINRVSTLSAPSNDGTPLITHRFFYELENNKAKPGRTIVYNALNYQTHYEYNTDQRLTAIKKLDHNHLVHTRERLFWGANNSTNVTNLMARVLENSQGVIQFARTYRYDDAGNVDVERLWGNLTGANSVSPALEIDNSLLYNDCEYYEKCYGYTKEDENTLGNLVILETDGRQATSFFYYPKTDRLRVKIKGYDNVAYLREFYEYNEDGALTKQITDDGQDSNVNNLAGVTERHIKYVVPRATYPYGLPETVEERYLDLKTGEEKLLHKTVNFYSKHGKLLRQDHYGSDDIKAYELLWEYDAHGNMTKEVDAMGREIIREYDLKNDRLVYEKGPNPNTHKTFQYDKMGRLVKEENIHPDGILVTTHRYDKVGNRIATVDSYGNETRFEYDAFGRMIKTILPPVANEEGQLYYPFLHFEFTEMSQVKRFTDARGHTITSDYTVRGQPINTNYADGTTESKLYYPNGLQKQAKAKNGAVTHFTYDFAQRPISQKTYSAEGEFLSETSLHYNTFHLLSETDALGQKTSYEYYPDGKLFRTIKGEKVAQCEYDVLGRLHRTLAYYGPSQEDVIINVQEYDLLNRVVEERIESYQGTIQNRICYEYDINGKREKVIAFNEKGTSGTTTIHDTHQEPIIVIDAEGNRTITTKRFDYINQHGQCVPYKEITDPMGNQTILISDALGRQTSMTRKNSIGQITQKQDMVYDSVGNRTRLIETVISHTVERQVVTAWAYDAANQMIDCYEAIGTPEQKHTQVHYNKYGEKDQVIKPDGTQLTHIYDSLGRLSDFRASDDSFHYTYEYDKNNNPIQVRDHKKNTSTIKVFDEHSNLVKETLGNSLKLAYTYDFIGRPKTITYPDGTSIRYDYDASRLKEIHRESTENYVHQYKKYDLSGKVIEAQLIGDAGSVSFDYDNLGRLRETKTPQWKETIEEFDKAGNLLSKEVQDDTGKTHADYTYDDLYQLKSEKGLAKHDYSYDSLYNCVEKDGKPRSFNALNQLNNDSEKTYTYDFNGNLTEKNTGEKYTYDALDRLIGYTQGNMSISYEYDEQNRRLSKKLQKRNKEIKIHYIYQGQNEVGACSPDGKIFELRLLGVGRGAEIGAAVAIELKGKAYAPIHDHQGNVTCLVDKKGNLFESYRYSSFGEELFDAGSNPWRFSSKRTDDETGLVLFGRRYYEPTTARWLTPDPIGFEGGPNLYAYVSNSPLTHFDTYGLYQTPGEVHSAHYTGSSNRPRNPIVENIIRIPGRVIESIGRHFPVPVVKDGIESFGRLISFQNPTFTPEWKRPSSQLIDHHGERGQMSSHETIMLFLGMCVSYDDANLRTIDLSMRLGDIDIMTVYKKDQGLGLNIIQCVLQRMGVTGLSTKVGREAARLASDRVGIDGTIYAFAHSQGGLVLDKVDLDIKMKMVAHTFGAAKLANPYEYKWAFNYVAQYDPIPYFDPLGMLRNKNITHLHSIGNPLHNHFLDGQTYKNVFYDVLNKIMQKKHL